MACTADKRFRCSMLIRSLRLMRLMSVQRLTLAQMARLEGVHERTIRRDIAAMEEAHLPIVKTDSGHYRLLEG